MTGRKERKKLNPDPLTRVETSPDRDSKPEARARAGSKSPEADRPRSSTPKPGSPLSNEVGLVDDHSAPCSPLSRRRTGSDLGKRGQKHADILERYRSELRKAEKELATSNKEVREINKEEIDETLLEALAQRSGILLRISSLAEKMCWALGEGLKGELVTTLSFEAIKESLVEHTKHQISFRKFNDAHLLALSETLLGDWCMNNTQHPEVAKLLLRQLELGNGFEERAKLSEKFARFTHLLTGTDKGRIDHLNEYVSKLARWRTDGGLEFFKKLLMKADEVHATIAREKDNLRVKAIGKLKERPKTLRVNSAMSLGQGLYEDFLDQFISWSEEFLKKEGLSDIHKDHCMHMLDSLKLAKTLSQPLSEEALSQIIFSNTDDRYPRGKS